MRFHKDNRILSASRLQVLSCQLSSQTKGACHWFFRYKVFTNDMVFVDGRFDRFETPWGYVKDGAGQFHAYIRDYQGSVVGVVNTAVSTRPLTQFTDYYPYGLPHDDATGVSVNRRKFGGKEYLTESGLNELDYGARHMLPQYGCFTSPDPKAIENTPFSPWAYCNGDPVNYSDPSGQDPVYSPSGKFLGTDDHGVKGMCVVMDPRFFSQGMDHSCVLRLITAYMTLMNRFMASWSITMEQGI